MKKNYINPKMSISKFDCEDVVCTSAAAVAPQNGFGGVEGENLGAEEISIFDAQ